MPVVSPSLQALLCYRFVPGSIRLSYTRSLVVRGSNIIRTPKQGSILAVLGRLHLAQGIIQSEGFTNHLAH
jgi:hypothetical protein